MINRFKKSNCIWKECNVCCPYLHDSSELKDPRFTSAMFRSKECKNKMMCDIANCTYYHNSKEMRVVTPREKEIYTHFELKTPRLLSDALAYGRKDRKAEAGSP
ncbi:hypothetical protein LguiA_007324 [Lonicera macranthoides]